MNKTLNKAIAKIAGVAMIASQLVVASPASAAVTLARDVMTRQQINEAGVTHTVTLTSDAAVSDGDFTLNYPVGFTAMTDGAGADSCAGGTLTFDSSTANTITYTTAGCGAGDLVMVFTATNPGTAGSYPVSVDGGTTDLPDGSYYAVPVTDEDQITVTASVDPYITFDLEASNTVCDPNTSAPTDHTPNAGTYTVALGTISPAAISSSENAGTRQHVCTTVSTNAADGYALSVDSLNGGLYNGSQYINDNSSGENPDTTMSEVTLAPGTEGYGLCLSTTTVPDMDTTTPAGSNLTADGDFDGGGTCDDTSAVVGQLTTATETIGGNAGPVQESTAQWNVKAAIAATTGAGSYTDTLTFIATGTF